MGFRRAEVIEIYSNPAELSREKLDQLLGYAPETGGLPPLDPNPSVILTMPRDALRARPHGEQTSIVCYPFFPSHLRLPVKVGEEVWIFQEELDQTSVTGFDPERTANPALASDIIKTVRNPATVPKSNRALAYWVCRPTQERQAEDFNYTSYGRSSQASAIEEIGVKQRVSPISDYKPEFLPLDSTGDDPITVAKGRDAHRARITSSLDRFAMEPVPRFTKLPGDTVIAGSNDSRIVLGSLRNGEPTKAQPGTGTIDLVAGTGQSIGAPLSIRNELGQEETNKDPGYTAQTEPLREGDPDILSDAARVMISESAPIDDLLGTDVSSQRWADTSAKTGPSIAARAQHVRVVATESGTVRITVEGPKSSSIVIDADGNVQISAESTVSVQAEKIFLGTTSDSPFSKGVVVGPGLSLILNALLADFRQPATGLPVTPAVLLPSLATVLQIEGAVEGIHSKTVFASS